MKFPPKELDAFSPPRSFTAGLKAKGRGPSALTQEVLANWAEADQINILNWRSSRQL